MDHFLPLHLPPPYHHPSSVDCVFGNNCAAAVGLVVGQAPEDDCGFIYFRVKCDENRCKKFI